ncbi:hypothetical protein [Undibacterium crateris]|uniref:hypothetical protein n=1 Tax=Undibacterium crateris TaxID=2528175 RepID=UPI00138A0766|nr:hypothetical protein [Undibacterium crateris]NDI85047.1 hypothetical protein [Undibacterium crateris]
MRPRLLNVVALTALLPLFSAVSHAGSILPGESEKLLPIMRGEIEHFWPDLARLEFIPAATEQESLNRIRAELKTSREYGCGIGQFTRAYKPDGSVRFDALEETKRLDPSLNGWTWGDCFNVSYQVRAVVLKLRSHNRACTSIMHDSDNSLMCAAAQYNGGAGSVNKRIRSCRMTPGCQPGIWAGNLENQCPQSRIKVAGYGEDFCTINSKYPGRVFARMPKYMGRI